MNNFSVDYGIYDDNFRKDANDEKWITINGTHFMINGEDEIIKGPQIPNKKYSKVTKKRKN